MGSLLVIYNLMFNYVFAENLEKWRQNLQQSNDHGKRITFGTAQIVENESDAIEKAKIIAKAEMIKTFKVKLKSESNQEIFYQQTNEKADSAKVYLNTSIHEVTEEIELTGLDLSNRKIDSEKGIVEVAAILNLKEYENYLTNNIKSNLKTLENLKTSKTCSSIDDLQKHRKYLRILSEAEQREQLLMTFSLNATFQMANKKEKQIKKLMDCRRTWSIVMNEVPGDVKDVIKNILNTSGYVVSPTKNRKPSNQQNIAISVKKEISKPEILFGRTNLTGKVMITLSVIDSDQTNFVWKSPTLRLADASLDSVQSKLSVRLNDQIIKGIKTLFEDHL